MVWTSTKTTNLVTETTASDVQQMARRILDAKRCIEVTMLSE